MAYLNVTQDGSAVGEVKAGIGNVIKGNTGVIHQPGGAAVVGLPVDDGFHALAGDPLRRVRSRGAAEFGDHRLGDGMGGNAFAGGCQTEDFLFRQVGESADFLYGKGAGGQGSGLIEDAVPDLGQCLHMAGAFDESAFF